MAISPLSGRTIIVTGALGAIGTGIMQCIRRHGGKPVGWDMREGPDTASVDVTDRQAVATALAGLGDAEGLVCAAGVNAPPDGTFFSVEKEDWDRVMSVNLWGAFNVLQSWARTRVGSGGSAVMIASIVTRMGSADNPHYVASKGGVDALTRSAAVALGGYGIRVNAVGPGPVPSAISHRVNTEEGRAMLTARTPMGHLGTPDNIGEAVVHLLSEASSWTTGATLYVDGGLTAGC